MIIDEKNYVDEAERAIVRLKDKKDNNGRSMPRITTTKIRNILSMAADIYNEVLYLQKDELDEAVCSRIDYLRVRLVYECGRERSVRIFAEEAKLLEILKSIQGSRKNYILFLHYIEALVAYHRFYGGRDN